MLICGFWNW